MKKFSVKKGTLPLRWESSPRPSVAGLMQSEGPGIDT